jgi:hypothetical protein
LSLSLLIYGLGDVSWQYQTKLRPYGIGSARLPDFFFRGTPVNSHEIWQWNRLVLHRRELRLYLERFWIQVALDYSRRVITYDRDRLPALSGLARRFRDVTGDMYLAGLWKETLCSGLMWHAVRELESRQMTYVAPSWSWLSFPTDIHYDPYLQPKESPLVEILKAEAVSKPRRNRGCFKWKNHALWSNKTRPTQRR